MLQKFETTLQQMPFVLSDYAALSHLLGNELAVLSINA